MKRRLEIVRRATEIFERKGFTQTSFEDIASAVGLKREALYYHFKNKSEILYDIIKPQSDALVRGLERISVLDAPFERRFALAIENHVERFSPNYLEMAVAYREISGREMTKHLSELRKTWKAYEKLWIDLIEAGQRSGEVDPSLNAKVVGFAVLGLCNSLSSWYSPEGPITLAQLMDTFFKITARGICTGPVSQHG
jgi:AcrR family transcriptional regulator